MGVLKYNISQEYCIGREVSVDMLCEKIPDETYRKILSSYVSHITWEYRIENNDMMQGSRQTLHRSLQIIEVDLKAKISSELLTEIMASIFGNLFVAVFVYKNEIALGTIKPKFTNVGEKEITTSSFYAFDSDKRLELIDYEEDQGKQPYAIHERLYHMIRKKKKENEMQEALSSIFQDTGIPEIDQNEEREPLSFDFSLEDLEQIRQDTEYVQGRLSIHNESKAM